MSENCVNCQDSLNLDEETILDRPITHEFCDTCYQNLPESAKKLEILNKLSVPIIGFNQVGVIEAANQQAGDLVQKDITQFINKKGGDVIGCIHADHPNGCGGTPNCEKCDVRSSIIQTHISGKAFTGKNATQILKSKSGPKKVNVEFSMERIKGLVLFRIDKWKEN